ncbi:hypothetical protein A3B57_02690, partial [Microgenomates group bacterium RIFCSPLOWO2_01_FULL_47_10]
MVKVLFGILKTARPRQWVKNFALYAPLLFSGFLFKPGYFERVTIGFGLFCLLASSLYFVNDIADINNDRHHPFKKKRPIASGNLSVHLAAFAAVLLLVFSLVGGYILSFFFFATLLAYALLQVFYSLWLKRLAIFDVISIAASFVLRIYAGAFVVNLHMSVWFLLTVISAALFLAVGKRQSERTLLTGAGVDLASHRSAQTHYTQRLLDIYTGMFANTTWLTYALFTFQLQFEFPTGPVPTLYALLPRTLVTYKWLMITVPVVIFGVMRYLQLVYEQNRGESPEVVLMSDKTMMVTATLWVTM